VPVFREAIEVLDFAEGAKPLRESSGLLGAVRIESGSPAGPVP